MRVLTVIADRGSHDPAWVVVEHGLRLSTLRHPTLDLAIEEAKCLATRAHRKGDPRDVRINHREGHELVPVPDDAAIGADSGPVQIEPAGTASISEARRNT